MVFNLLIIHTISGQFDSFGPDSEDEQEELIHSGTTEDDSEEDVEHEQPPQGQDAGLYVVQNKGKKETD